MYTTDNEMEVCAWDSYYLEGEEHHCKVEIERDIKQLEDTIGYLVRYARDKDKRALLMKQRKDLLPLVMRLFDLTEDIRGKK